MPMRFPPSLLDEIRARLPVSQVVSRKVALKRAGREFKGLSPFKAERTPSFTVNDQVGPEGAPRQGRVCDRGDGHGGHVDRRR